MKNRAITAALACAAAVSLVGCDPAATDPKPAAPAASEPTAAMPTATPYEETEPAESKAVLNFVGMGLQSAQDKAQAEGFSLLKSHDSAGRDRLQALDRNWKVCSQSVEAGRTVPTETELDFGAVKLEETCPAADAKAPAPAAGKMPNLVGKSVKAARGALDSGTSVTTTDAAEGRMVLLESNWQVCTQSPAPGAELTGQPVEFTAVKFEESCP
ncbi:PASTA domain-containing protein [Streptomyces sp. NPDC102415]|uniref:PASTA domain-containing protein n=1 Tax=unclassified Streptomyces TaxID=2593676 RepID=UPI003826F13C